MTRFKRFASVLTTLLFSAWVSASSGALARSADGADDWNGSEINWRTLQSGVKEATTTGKTVILVFHATWCTSCKKYRTVFRDPGVVGASKNYVMVLVDVDKDPTANSAFSPDGTYVPRTLFITPEGDVRSDLVSKADPEHPHSLDVANPGELLSLMQRGAQGGGAPDAPASKGLDERAEN
jgi:protein-disulfide reductase (glutathione)